ncbi:MAG: phosphopantothenate/pantothenate synthetase [bacterium]
MDIPENHPRYNSLLLRHKLEEGVNQGLVTPTGMVAHGRGEAFDYLLGEATPPATQAAIEAACALLLLAKHPVLSLNGNTTVLVPEEMIALGNAIPAKLEVNVFYGRTEERERKLAKYLEQFGAKNVLGVNPDGKIPLLESARGNVSKEGISAADVVLVALEDGDRTEALIKMGKKVIAIDLNPLSRTPQMATVAIVDNITRCVPLLTKTVETMRSWSRERLQDVAEGFDNTAYLRAILEHISNRLVKKHDPCC